MKTTRIPHAPGTPLPELAEFLAPFRAHFQRGEGPRALERSLTGLLTVTWREGSRGRMRGRFVALRTWRVTSSGRRRAGWLIGEDASDGKRRYSWSDCGPGVAPERMVEYAHRRHRRERYPEEAKGLLGRDQDQGRQWRGSPRHAVSVMLASSSPVWREWQQRQERARPGRPWRAFSPSAGPASRVPTGDPSPGLRLAPPRSGRGVAVA